MRLLFTLLILALFGRQSLAAQADDFVNNYEHLSTLERATEADDFCTQVLKAWPAPDYTQSMLHLGELWRSQPEAAYYLIKTCQSEWTVEYLDVSKLKTTGTNINHARLAELISNWEFIEAAPYFPQELLLFKNAIQKSGGGLPPSPFEILTGMASDERQLDEALNYEMNNALSDLAALGGGLVGGGIATSLETVKKVSGVLARTSLAAGRLAKQMLVVSLAAYATHEAAQIALTEWRESDLWKQVRGDTSLLTSRTTVTPLALADFYRAVLRLGYFYNYGLYLSDSGHSEVRPRENTFCYPGLNKFFRNPTKTSWASDFQKGSSCSDAAALWIGASQFLDQQLPTDPEAKRLSVQLMSLAKRTFLSYRETRESEKTLLHCTPKLLQGAGQIVYRCLDPLTGQEVL